MTVSNIKSERIWHDSSGNNIRKNDTGQTGTMHYDIFRRITRLQTVLLHSIHCKHQFRILQYIIFEKWHRTNRYDALRYISTYYKFTNGSAAFDTLQVRIPHITVYYICRHILITFVTVLHLITPQWHIDSEFIRNSRIFSRSNTNVR